MKQHAFEKWLDPILLTSLMGSYLALLLCTVETLGYARDEGFYFQAADSYGAWFSLLLEDPGRALEQSNIDRFWKVNREHPAFVKSLFAWSHALLYEQLGWFSREGTSYRFPGMVLSSVAVGVTFAWGRRAVSRFAGVVAALSFAFMPRVFYHAHLDCFDMPIVAMWLVTAYAYWRCFEDRSWRWAIVTGLLYGLMLNTKHNSWLFPPVVVAHLVLTRGKRLVLDARYGNWAPFAALASLVVIGPLLFYTTWPWLWAHPFERFAQYVRFHTGHDYYNMEFLGVTYWEPPMPLGYAWVMTLATVPLVTLVLFVLGTITSLREAKGGRWQAWVLARLGKPTPKLPPQSRRSRSADSARSLWLLSIGCSYGPWILPTTPIFGGTKHWLTAYPFVALLAGLAASRVARHLVQLFEKPERSWTRPVAHVALAASILAGPCVLAVRSHPWGLSTYTPIVGGAAGAATLGLNRTFWGYTTGSLAPYLASHAAEGDEVYVHDTALQSWAMMSSEGRFGASLGGTLDIARSDFALYHHEPHMTRVDAQIWSVYGTCTPAAIGDLDGVPVTWVYARPE